MAATVPNRSDWLVIGISGVTCGGKTSLANRLKSALWPVHVFNQDQYFFPDDSPRHVPCEGLPHHNYDILSALDMEAMFSDICKAMSGQDTTHAAAADHVEDRFQLLGKKFLVVEGFTVLNYPPIMELCDLRYYFVLEYGECMMRRAFRLYDPPDIAGYFEQCVWPEHIRYRAEIERDGRAKLLDGTQANAFETVMADLQALNT